MPTPNALGRRYAPFIAVAAVQVLLVAITPSKDSDRGNEVAAVNDGQPNAGPFDGTGTFTPDGETGAPGEVVAGSSGATGSRPTTGSGNRPGAGSGSSGGAGTSGTVVASGDLSRCTPEGFQIGPTYYMPRC